MAGGHRQHRIGRRRAGRRRRAVVWLLSLLATGMGGVAGALGGAWTLPPGGAEAWTTTLIAGANAAFGPGYQLQSGASYRKVEQNVILEYGLGDGVTGLFATQFLAVTLGGPNGAQYAGPGYSDVGARVRLAQGDTGQGGTWVVSAQAVARAPGAAGSGSRAAVGYTDWEADLRLLAGVSFPLWGQPGFLDLEVAQRQRFGDPPNELRADATLGVELRPGWLGLLQSFNVVSEGAGAGPDFKLSYGYSKLQLGLLVNVNAQLSLGAGVFTTYLARNFPQENGLVLAARVRF